MRKNFVVGKHFVMALVLATTTLVGCGVKTSQTQEPKAVSSTQVNGLYTVCHDGLEFLMFTKFRQGGGLTQVMDSNGNPKLCD